MIYRGQPQANMGLTPNSLKPASSPATYFSPRERQVLPGVISGWAYKEIASELDITERTVAAHVSSLLRKLNLRDRGELYIWCSQNPEDAKRGVTRRPGLHPDDCNCGGHYCSMRRSLLDLAA